MLGKKLVAIDPTNYTWQRLSNFGRINHFKDTKPGRTGGKSRQAIQRAQRAEVKEIKIQVSGCLNGAEIARTEWGREGRVPLHTLQADIDYAYRTAQTIYGILGIKVWVFKGEILPGEEEKPLSAVAAPSPRGRRRRQQFEDRSE